MSEEADMVLGEEKEIKMVQFAIDISHETRKHLLRYGRQHIVNDEDEIINYAVNKLLAEAIAKAEE